MPMDLKGFWKYWIRTIGDRSLVFNVSMLCMETRQAWYSSFVLKPGFPLFSAITKIKEMTGYWNQNPFTNSDFIFRCQVWSLLFSLSFELSPLNLLLLFSILLYLSSWIKLLPLPWWKCFKDLKGSYEIFMRTFEDPLEDLQNSC